MNKIFCKFEPVDFIAIIVIIGGLYLKLCGADGIVGTLLVSVVFYYFGKKGLGSLQNAEDKKNNEKLQTK